MGNDGGSIPTRRELVKEAARNPTASELKDKQKEHLAHRWSNCPVSLKPLVKPVVSDYSGDLYNKDAIIQFLLPAEASSVDKEEYEKFIQGRVKSLKDVVEIQFEVEHDEKTRSEKWVCPVTSKELGPNVKAVYLVPCGHAFSQEAIKEMKSEGKCVQCATSYEERDVIPILPSTEQDKAFVIQRIETLKSLGLTHSLKKASGSKKRKANGDSKIESAENGVTDNKEKTSDGKAQPSPADLPRAGIPQSGTSTPKASNGIKNSATASLTARVLEEEEARKKRRRENENISSLYTKKSDGRKDGDFMTRGFSIPANARHQ
ncbi:Replication termination factor 2 [Elasticomyces elasticus]|uniref:Replication termination factor 2 n=1 Tax=Exophiala sideris TaxID=1016849 RepID=A0ABR0J5W9_9EURO|nr:Replication termination factor 2 [Elasticomyces elasticus]KAK5028696.1 Replication termination factor 2 [Exophiala sideris]KAK5035564.1 Replication termination factor 2 [Exophiala sideris]KAK5057200.1 Replication termination factor 2 [Exophiala sideris]KAK5181827.1 Replication termination factor 2 [Eurotiomycetes sp. CCFEE 6388]